MGDLTDDWLLTAAEETYLS